MLKNFDHVFFDLDRTLWDFETNSSQTLHELFTEFSLEKKLGTTFETFIAEYHRVNDLFWQQYRDGLINKEGLRYARFEASFQFFGLNDPALAEAVGEQYVVRSPRRTALIDGALDLLRHLQHNGVPMSVITNGFDEVQHLKMQASGISHFFQHTITSELVGVRKPHPGIFEHALRLTNTFPHRVVMVGDHFEADIDGALLAGWHAVYLLPSGDMPIPRPDLTAVRSLRELIVA